MSTWNGDVLNVTVSVVGKGIVYLSSNPSHECLKERHEFISSLQHHQLC